MNSNKKLLTIIMILLVMCTGISISYAFFKVASSNNIANSTATINGANLCMSLQLSSNNITLSNEYAVPVSDAKALSADVYKTDVSIQNNCGDSQSFNLLLVPSSSNTMPIRALKYALVENGVTPTTGTLISNAYSLDNTIKKQLLSIKNETLKTGYSVGSGTVNANISKTFSLYLWIDKDEGGLGNGVTMDKVLSSYLTLGSGNTIGSLKYGLYQTIENRYNEDQTYLGLYTGEGADTYANPVYYYKGNVQNNNVLFGGFCWKIVRTTDTGGVKLVYNGVQNDYAEAYTLLNESEYANLSNDVNYPYTFDSTNKTWASTNTGENSSTITFTAPSNGSYVLNYDLSMTGNYMYHINVEIFKDDVSQGKFSGITTGQIIFNNLSPSNVIKVVYSRYVYYSSGTRNNVIFSFGKVNKIVKSCNNNGINSQIGTRSFSLWNLSDSPAYVGYMYNNAYPATRKVLLNYAFKNKTAYADSVTYDDNTNIYSLDSTTASTTYRCDDLIGKYTCGKSSTTETCENAKYIVGCDGLSKDHYYYYSLSNGDVDGTDNVNSFAFGNSFTYANGIYTLKDTVMINTNNWSTDRIKLNEHHYTCLSNDTTCTSLYYIYYLYYGDAYYITLKDGKSINDALNEMLYADDVNKNDSEIKTYLENWYKTNLIKYKDNIEDTIFCNDRSISNLYGWDPNGGDVGGNKTLVLQFKNFATLNGQSLVCANETDRFSMGNAKAKLIYPIGLLSVPELRLSEYGAGADHYYNNGKYNLTISPGFYGNYDTSRIVFTTSDDFTNWPTSDGVPGVRPSISLKPGIEYASGDGSFTNPFVIE